MRCLDERTLLQKGAGREEPLGRRVSIVCPLSLGGNIEMPHPRGNSSVRAKKSILRGTSDRRLRNSLRGTTDGSLMD